MLKGSAVHWLLYRFGLRAPHTQTTAAERACLAQYAAGRKRLVEIGVMHGVSTAVLCGAMDPEAVLTAIDPHPAGRLGVSFERLVAQHEIRRCRRGRVVLDRRLSHEAVQGWAGPIDFLFIDGDHSWNGIDRDWRDWSVHLAPGGIVALHDSRVPPGVVSAPLDSVRYTTNVILADARFKLVTGVDSLTILERIA